MDSERLIQQSLTVQEYADRYRLHVQTVYTAIRQGHPLAGGAVVERPTPRTIRIVLPVAA